MKKLLFITFLIISHLGFSQVDFDTYFTPKTLRFDYIHAGNADTAYVYFQDMKQEPFWGGSMKNLIDTFNYGQYRLMVYDFETEKLIYSRGYATLFYEWQTTSEAQKINRSFYETVVMPYPKKKVKIELQKRNKQNQFLTLFSMPIDPTSYFISQEMPPKFNTKKIHDAGDSHKKLDVAIIAEGYTQETMDKFRNDAKRFTEHLFNTPPFDKHKDKINVWIVESVSLDNGTDIPGDSIWKKTAINSNFYTFDSERYLTTSDVKTLRDAAANVPYDQIYLLVNTEKYGGGGIFNFYSVCSSDNVHSPFVFVHEFGHAFAALADEYYTSQTSYNDFYDLTVEPYQANITTLVNFDAKWKNMLGKDVPVPTPATKKYKDKVGVFEGGGYVAKGIYRPAFNCIMKSSSAKGFCPVCQKAISRMILFYSE